MIDTICGAVLFIPLILWIISSMKKEEKREEKNYSPARSVEQKNPYRYMIDFERRVPYRSHCRVCHTGINSLVCLRCSICGWYRCNECGACGCMDSVPENWREEKKIRDNNARKSSKEKFILDKTEELLSYNIGDRIFYYKFGYGEIEEMNSGKIVINFDKSGLQTFDPKMVSAFISKIKK